MTQHWRDRYADKLLTPDKAIGKIRPGARVFIGSACGEPQALVRALVVGGEGLADTELLQVLTFGVAPYADPKYADRFRANAFFIGNSVRNAVNEARADYTPVFLSRVPALFTTKQIPIDVALVMVSPPDPHGYCSLGVSVDITKSAAESAKMIIAQVNSHMPRTMGDTFLHVSRIGYLVECNEPLLEWPVAEAPDADNVIREIAEHTAQLVPDGATLQLGIGRLPDAILSLLESKIDLGIHTEMFSDGVMKLAQAGVITGRRKTLHTGKIVGSFAAGTRELFDFLDDNPQIEMHPSEYTNDPFIISRHENMVAINSALEVDLTGQVCADSIGQYFYSGLGGHADFIRGAAFSKGGRPIIVIPSTAHTEDGILSRITPAMREGAGVVTTRGDTHYVVTEHGAAYLQGKTLRERAMALIGVAHPDFRSELLHAAKRRHMVYLDQILPPAKAPYPEHLESTATLKDGTQVLVRPVRPQDEPMMKDMFYSFSEQTMRLRFHSYARAMPHQRLQVFCNVDYDTEMALIGLVGPRGHEEVIAIASYISDATKTCAEVAFVVRDDWQRKGLGSYLFAQLVEISRSKGIRDLEAYVLTENAAMLKVFHGAGLETVTSTEDGVVQIVIHV
ncbi:MAG: GNAT family N-acetyltransferase [Phycisphaerae bacterium]|nr:GNAT family N-acetyltransferase [Phycisphaerae bacterium]